MEPGNTVKRKSHQRKSGLAAGPARNRSRVSGRLWVEKDGETFISWGRVILLERIKQRGSISAAARSMQMGYRHAWQLVESMNRQSPRPLVDKTMGGEGGGGATLTPHGEATIAAFWELVARFREWISQQDPRLWLTESERQKGQTPGTLPKRKRGQPR